MLKRRGAALGYMLAAWLCNVGPSSELPYDFIIFKVDFMVWYDPSVRPTRIEKTPDREDPKNVLNFNKFR